MDKRFSWIFIVAAGVFFVFVVGLTGYRIENARRLNRAAVERAIPELAAQAASLRDTAGGFDTPAFKTGMREVFDSDPRLLLLSIHSADSGMIYLVTRDRSYLRDPAPPSPDWRGTPRYRVSQGYEILLTQDIQDGDVSVPMDGLSLIMGREDLYPIVRDDLYMFLAFLLVCGVLILIMLTIQEDQRSAPSQRKPAPEPASPPPRREQPRVIVPEAAVELEDVPTSGGDQPGRALTSPRTGLSWADHLEPRLKAELERAAASDQDVALAKVRIDEPFADAKLPLVYADVAHVVRDSFPLRDLLFESGNDSFAIVLPDTDVDAAVRQIEDLRKKISSTPIQGTTRTVSVGVTSRGGRLIAESVLRDEAEIAVAKAAREGGNQVIGFRADPGRFRDTLTESVS
jgi:GGDEF domain-containing protein